MTRIPDLETVVRNGLCTGCGICAGIAGRDRVRMAMSPIGFLRPVVERKLDRATTEAVLKACPGIRITGADRSKGPVREDVIWGRHVRLAKGHAADPEIRFTASSGGILSALSIHLLETGAVDFILHVAASKDAPMRSTAKVSFDRTQILEGASARYGPAAPLADLGTLLAQNRRFAVVGKPCDIAALRNYAKLDPRVDRLIPYRLAFFCGGVSSLTISQRMVSKYGIGEADVRLLRYRGHGCPGMTRIEARDGRVFEQTYDETWGDELNQEIQFRCKICPDATGEQADLVCGDAWVTEDGYAGHVEREGWNAIIARSDRGAELLAEAESAGRVQLEPLTIAELGRMQPHQVERKKAVLSRLAALAAAGRPRPRFRRLRLWRAALSGGVANRRNFRGMLKRLARGANREPLPVASAPDGAERPRIPLPLRERDSAC